MFDKFADKLTWRSERAVAVLGVLTLSIFGCMLYIAWAISNVYRTPEKMPSLVTMFPDGLLVKVPMLYFDFSPFDIHQALLSAYGKHGRKLYVLFRVIDHTVFPFVYTAALLSLNAYLSPKAEGFHKRYITWVPVGLFFIDILENSGFIYLLLVFEENDKGDPVKENVATASMVVQFFKVTLNFRSCGLCLFIGV